jgi:hypothetical protein
MPAPQSSSRQQSGGVGIGSHVDAVDPGSLAGTHIWPIAQSVALVQHETTSHAGGPSGQLPSPIVDVAPCWRTHALR